MKKNKAAIARGMFIAAGLCGALISHVVFADGRLTPQDALVTTLIDKSVLAGSLAHNADGTLNYDDNGSARFVYSGKIFSVGTNEKTGELKELKDQIGTIEGEAAFPKEFVAMTAAINYMMDMQAQGIKVPMPPMPAVVPWTCNHCKMVVAGTTYLSIVDVLGPNGSPAMKGMFDQMLIGGAAGASKSMGMDGRAFTGLTPASYDPINKTMSVRMAGCSAVVAVDGPQAGKMGTLCMNSTATFNVSKAIAIVDNQGNPVGYQPTSDISAQGSSNCITVLHTPLTM